MLFESQTRWCADIGEGLNMLNSGDDLLLESDLSQSQVQYDYVVVIGKSLSLCPCGRETGQEGQSRHTLEPSSSSR